MTEYQKPEYANGQFGYQILLQSGLSFLESIPDAYVQEIRELLTAPDLLSNKIVILTPPRHPVGMRSIIFRDPEHRGP